MASIWNDQSDVPVWLADDRESSCSVYFASDLWLQNRAIVALQPNTPFDSQWAGCKLADQHYVCTYCNPEVFDSGDIFKTFETYSCILQEKDAYETEFRDLLTQPIRDGWHEMLKDLIQFEQLEREMENQLDAQALDVEGNVEGMTFRGDEQNNEFSEG